MTQISSEGPGLGTPASMAKEDDARTGAGEETADRSRGQLSRRRGDWEQSQWGGAKPSDSENARQFRGHWLSHWSLLCLKPGNAPGVFRLVVRKKLPF